MPVETCAVVAWHIHACAADTRRQTVCCRVDGCHLLLRPARRRRSRRPSQCLRKFVSGQQAERCRVTSGCSVRESPCVSAFGAGCRQINVSEATDIFIPVAELRRSLDGNTIRMMQRCGLGHPRVEWLWSGGRIACVVGACSDASAAAVPEGVPRTVRACLLFRAIRKAAPRVGWQQRREGGWRAVRLCA